MPPAVEKFSTLTGYRLLERELDSIRARSEDEWLEWNRAYFLADLFFALNYVLSTQHWRDEETGRKKCFHPWVLERCREIEEDGPGCLAKCRIWSREHLKSTAGTFARTLQLHAGNPDLTTGIFSFKREISTRFGARIKKEVETNDFLRLLSWNEALGDYVFWREPKSNQGYRWGMNALEFKTKTNVQEASIECHGFVEGLPTSSHFMRLVFDDAVQEDAVSTPEMKAKNVAFWKSAMDLGKEGGWEEYYGTFYAPDDLYNEILDRGAADPDVRPCCEYIEKRPGGLPVFINPVFYDPPYLAKKFKQKGEESFGVQWMCDPLMGKSSRLRSEDVRFYGVGLRGEKFEEERQKIADRCSIYILVDPANTKKKRSDFTAMAVVGVDSKELYFVLDIVRDKLSPAEKLETLFDLYERWGPIEQCRYEEYGMQNDLFLLEREMDARNKWFEVVAVGGNASKEDRITSRLQPILSSRSLVLPERLLRPCKYLAGASVDLVQVFLHEELEKWPLPRHEDLLDCLSRMNEPGLDIAYPASSRERRRNRDRWARAEERQLRQKSRNTSWMSM